MAMPMGADDDMPGGVTLPPSQDVPLLHWIESDRRLTKGLRDRFAATFEGYPGFITIRLGSKWAKLDPRDIVQISIGKNADDVNVIGEATVISVKKIILAVASANLEPLVDNIGAKDWQQAQKDLRLVYGSDRVHQGSVITILRLMPVRM